jgi:hypothetical protein
MGRDIAIFAVLVIITVVIVQPLHKKMVERITALRDSFITSLEDFLGRPVSYGSIRPSLSHCDIDTLTIAGSAADLPPTLSLANIRLSYSLRAFLSGEGIKALRTISIKNPIVRINLEHDADLISRLFPAQDTLELDQFFSALNKRFSLILKDAALSLVQARQELALRALDCELSLHNERIVLRTKLVGYGTTAQDGATPLSLQAALQFDGSSTTDLQTGAGTLNIAQASVSSKTEALVQQLKPLNLYLTMQESSITLSKQTDKLPFAFYASYDRQFKALSGRFDCDNFSPGSLLSLASSVKGGTAALAATLSGSALVYKTVDKPLYYSAALTGTVPETLIGKQLSFSLIGSGDTDKIAVTQLLCAVPQGTVQFQGSIAFKPFLPDGILSITDFSLSGTERCNGVFAFAAHENTVLLTGKDAFIGTVPLSTVQASFLIGKESLKFNLSAVRPTETALHGRVALDGSFDYRHSYLDLTLSFKAWSPLDIPEMAAPFVDMSSTQAFPARDILGAVTAGSEIFIATDFKHLSFNIPQFELAYQGEQSVWEGTVISAALSGTETRVVLHEMSIGKKGHDKLTMNGELDFTDINTIIFNLATVYQNIPYQISGILLDRQSLSIQGLYNIRVQVETDSGAFAGYIEADALPFSYKGQLSQISTTASFRYDSVTAWSFYLDNLEVLNLSFPLSTHTSVRIAGRANQNEMVLNRISFDDGQGSLNGTLSASWNTDFSDISGTINLSNETGSEYYAFSGNRKEERLVLHLDGSRMRPGRFAPVNTYNAVLTGNIDIVWDSPSSYQILVNFPSVNGTIGGNEAQAQGRIVIDNNTVSIEDFNAAYLGLELSIPALQTNRSEGLIETNAQLGGKFIGWDIGARLHLNVKYKPVDSWLDVDKIFSVLQGTVVAYEGRFSQRPVASEPFYFEFDHKDSVLSLIGGPREMIRLKLFDTGDLYIGISAPSAIRGAITGTVVGSDINAQISNAYVDLGSLWAILPPDWQQIINVPGGFVTAQSIQVTGPLVNPEFFGTAQVHSLRMQVPLYLEHDIRPTPFTVIFNGSDMFFNTVFASIGSGVASATGSFKFDRWVPDVFDLALQIPDASTAVPFQATINGIHAHGNATGTLLLSMNKDLFMITGALTAHDAEVTVNTDELIEQEAGTNTPDALNTIIDLALHTGSKVRFLWPDAKNPIIQANAGAGNSLAIKSDTASGRFSIVGDIKIRSGTVFYTPRNFYIREGTLTFNENEVQIAPKLSVRAELRDRNDNGPVTIRMLFENVSLADIREVEPRWESDPALSQLEIVALLGHDLAGNPDEGTSSLMKSLIAVSTDVLSQFQAIRIAEQWIRDFLKLDMFSIRTQVLQNMALQSWGLRNVPEGISIAGNYFDNTTVFLGKYLNPNIFVHAMLTTRYDDGLHHRKGLRLGGLMFEPEFGIELGTVLNLGILGNPRLDIRGNINPLHPENLFVNDLAFTFLFNWSF